MRDNEKHREFEVNEEIINQEEDSEQGSQLQSNQMEQSMGNKKEND
ncbi:hypothetical protein [Pseudogracilibacillus sp. SO30301A]